MLVLSNQHQVKSPSALSSVFISLHIVITIISVANVALLPIHVDYWVKSLHYFVDFPNCNFLPTFCKSQGCYTVKFTAKLKYQAAIFMQTVSLSSHVHLPTTLAFPALFIYCLSQPELHAEIFQYQEGCICVRTCPGPTRHQKSLKLRQSNGAIKSSICATSAQLHLVKCKHKMAENKQWVWEVIWSALHGVNVPVKSHYINARLLTRASLDDFERRILPNYENLR